MGIFMVQGAASGLIGTLAACCSGCASRSTSTAIVPAIERLLRATFLPSNVYLISRMPSDPRAGDIVPIVLISLLLSSSPRCTRAGAPAAWSPPRRCAMSEAIVMRAACTSASPKAALDVHVLQGVDLEVQQGETIAIVGASGSGKSTLLHLLGGLEAPTAGTVLLAGATSRRWARPSRATGATGTSASSTSSTTCCPSSRRWTTWPCRCASAAWTPRSARAGAGGAGAGGPGRARRHRPSQLSGGERQRVAIARALAGEPGCVLADEPTGNLDRETADGVFALMLDLARRQGMAFVLVTHDESLAARCDRVLRLVKVRLAP